MGIKITYTSNNQPTLVRIGDSGSNALGASYSKSGILIQSAGLDINGSYIPLRFKNSTKEYPKVLYTTGSTEITSILSKESPEIKFKLDEPLDIKDNCLYFSKSINCKIPLEIIAEVEYKHIGLLTLPNGHIHGIQKLFLGQEAIADPSVI